MDGSGSSVQDSIPVKELLFSLPLARKGETPAFQERKPEGWPAGELMQAARSKEHSLQR